jgi:hypothetical protein
MAALRIMPKMKDYVLFMFSSIVLRAMEKNSVEEQYYYQQEYTQ